MSEHITPTPLDLKRGHATQVFRQKKAIEALKLQSVRTASVPVWRSESGVQGYSLPQDH